MDRVTQNQRIVQFEVLTDIGQTVEATCGHSDTDPTGCKLCGTDSHWTNCRRQQWA